MKRRILTVAIAMAICLCGYAFIYGEDSTPVDNKANLNQKEQAEEVRENVEPNLSEDGMEKAKDAEELDEEEPSADELNKEEKAPLLKSPEETRRNEWIIEDGVRYYLDSNGERVKGVYAVGNTIYYFDPETGAQIIRSGWIDWNWNRYFSNASGELYHDMFITFGSKRYYMGEDGAVKTGVYRARDGRTYYADEDGLVKQEAGWIEENGNRYFANANGELYRNMFITFGRDRYYMGEDGSAQTGIFRASNGNLYIADETGLVGQEAGWIEQDGKRYFSNANGELYHDMIITFGRDWYYMGEDGSAQTGSFRTKDGRIFEADETGLIQRNVGWKEKDGKRYFYSNSGELYYNMFITFGRDRYYMGEDGSAQTGIFRASNGNLYIADETGLVGQEAGWIEQDGKRYFSNANGELYHDMIITFGRDWYYMGEDGSAQTGSFRTKDGRIFEADETGLIKRNVGWKEKDGKRYFYSDSGELYRNMIITFGRDRYYMGEDGFAQTGIFRASNGNIYVADETGLIGQEAGWIEENGKRYFSSDRGEIYRNRIISFGEKKYYMGEDGSVQSGIINAGGEYYYADPNNDNQIVTTPGWLTVDGTKYFVSPDGSFYHNRFITFGDIAYYLNTDGTIVKTAFNMNGVGIRPDPETGEIPISQYNNYMGSFNNTPYSTVVIIEIGRQVLKYFRNGELLLYCDVVTGNPHGYSTPTGTYSILRKTPGTYLVGSDYRVWVDYWMPFIRNEYGIHDSNRPVDTFGGNTYFHRGSHGCVNLPKWAAAKLYSLVSVGTRVVIRQ